MSDSTNSLTKTLAPVAGAGTGVALATNASDDWIKILGIIISALSLILPIIQNILARRNQPKE